MELENIEKIKQLANEISFHEKTQEENILTIKENLVKIYKLLENPKINKHIVKDEIKSLMIRLNCYS